MKDHEDKDRKKSMTPAPDLAHQDVAGEIYRQIANELNGKPELYDLRRSAFCRRLLFNGMN